MDSSTYDDNLSYKLTNNNVSSRKLISGEIVTSTRPSSYKVATAIDILEKHNILRKNNSKLIKSMSTTHAPNTTTAPSTFRKPKYLEFENSTTFTLCS